MRIKFEGKRSLEDLREQLEICLRRMETFGIKYVSGTNLYFNPTDEGGQEVIIQLENGQPLEGWVHVSPKKIQKAKSARVLKLAVNNEKSD